MNELLNYVSDPTNPNYTFSLGLWYEDRGHVAAAAGFFLRTAECSFDDLLAYEALLRISNCYTRMGNRTHIVKGLLLRAISLLPKRPEAYFLLSQLYERNSEWHESYTFAVMGEQLGNCSTKLRTNVDYPGHYGFTFERAVSAWWIGLFDESLHLLRQLKKDTTMLPVHIMAVRDNLNRLENTLWRNPLTYQGSMYERLRVKFPGSKEIQQNYSQVYQDMFALTVLGGKRNGTFFEIGCNDPEYLSNTKLLEEWGWTGTSIDRDAESTKKWMRFGTRKTVPITADALMLDYDSLIQHDYDYLQIDIEPPLQSLTALLKLPLEKHKFAVITFEHDDYCSNDDVKERSRIYLRSHGYVMAVGDVSFDDFDSFEDWWIHPDLVDSGVIEKMKDVSEGPKRADRYMLL